MGKVSPITDHGGMQGLTDDDHTQYVLHTEVDDTAVNGATTDPISSNWAFDHEAAADPHTGYRLESADHSHQSTGAQAGTLDHGLALTGLTDDDHTQYQKESALLSGRVRGLTGANNSGTPNTQYDFAADAVTLADTATSLGLVDRTNTGTLTNNVSTAGPAAGGRDQAGVFSASSWIHFYFIWNGSTLSTVSSATAPPTGPTLPSTYTHWAYIGAIRFNSSSELFSTQIRGSNTEYNQWQAALTAGTATTETAISLSTLIPPNASMSSFYLLLIMAGTVNAVGAVSLRLITGVDAFQAQAATQVTTVSYRTSAFVTLVNVGQNIYYIWTDYPDTTKDAYVRVTGYTIPNGDS